MSSFRVLSFEPATLALWLCQSLSSHGWCSQYTWQLGAPSLPRRCSRPSPLLHFSASPPSTLWSSMHLGCLKEEWHSNEYRLVDSNECLHTSYPLVPSSALLFLPCHCSSYYFRYVDHLELLCHSYSFTYSIVQWSKLFAKLSTLICTS